MTEVLEMLSSFIVEKVLLFALVGLDERRLARRAPGQLARAWPPASKASALVLFGPLALVVHFVRTRRSLQGGVLGVALAAAVLAAEVAGAELALALSGLPAPASMNHGALR